MITIEPIWKEYNKFFFFLWDFSQSSKIFYYGSNIRNIIVVIIILGLTSFLHDTTKEASPIKEKRKGKKQILKKTTSVFWYIH